jgi:hypothetical protein
MSELYVVFLIWVMPRRLNLMCRRFETLGSIFPSNLVPVILPAYTTYEDGTERVFRNAGT